MLEDASHVIRIVHGHEEKDIVEKEELYGWLSTNGCMTRHFVKPHLTTNDAGRSPPAWVL